MQSLKAKKILVGICGSIAAYKVPFLIRELKQLNAEVRIIMSKSSKRFVSPLTMQALSGNDVRSSLFDQKAELAMSHIELANWADCLLIVPATANCLAKMAAGLADDLLTTIYLANNNLVFFCPAMNEVMWLHPATQANYKILQERGGIFIGPDIGWQACGTVGTGRVSETKAIINILAKHFALEEFNASEINKHLQLNKSSVNKSLAGQKVLITAGPTREDIDPVRYISNRSSGKMGYALAQAALKANAAVILISGPTTLPPPIGVKTIYIESTLELQAAIFANLQPDSIFIGAAAVSDYRLQSPFSSKLKKNKVGHLTLKLIQNPDLLAEVAASNRTKFVVGFAAETEEVIANATYKLQTKKLNMIIANKVGKSEGFDSDYNEVAIITNDKQITLPLAHKNLIAKQIIALIANNI